MPDQPASLSENLKDLLTPQKDFPVFMKVAALSADTDAPRVDLLYLRYLEATPDEQGLAEIVCHQVVNYALPKRKIKELIEQSAGTLDLSLHSKLLAEARRAFIEYDDKATGSRANVRYAEIGEVIAFCVASHYLTAGQVAAKMALKTNSEMPVYGLDGIHIRAEPDGTVTVFFMEAKMVGDAESGAEQYANSAGGFANDRKHKLNEQRIARDLSNLDVLEKAAKEAALDYFDPYSQKQETVRERFVGVVVHSCQGYADKIPITDATPLDAHEKKYLAHYSPQKASLSAKMKKALDKVGVEHGRCRTFFLAVPDVANLKKLFSEAMKR